MKKQITLLVLASTLIATQAFADINTNPITINVTVQGSSGSVHAYGPGNQSVLITSGSGTFTVPSNTPGWSDLTQYGIYIDPGKNNHSTPPIPGHCAWGNNETAPTLAPAELDIEVTVSGSTWSCQLYLPQ